MNNTLLNKAKETLGNMSQEELLESLIEHGIKFDVIADQELFYSTDGEDYSHSELQEAIDELYNNTLEGETILGNIVYYGVGIKPEPIKLCDARDVMDTVADRAWDWGGEHADGFLDGIAKEALDELNELLTGWYNKHLSVNFWKIDTKTIKKYIITEEDVKERQ